MRPPRGGGSFRGRGGRDGGDALVVDLVTKDLPAKSLVRFLILFDDSHSWFTDQAEEFLDKVSSFDINEQVATFLHACEGDAVTKLSNEKIPYFNAPIYLQNKTQIGRVDEIYGPINESLFSIKMMVGIVATSYTQGEKFFIDPGKLLPLSRFLPQPKGQSGGRGGGRGAPRGRGNFRGGGRGFQPRGGSRGGFGGRGRG